MALRVRSVNIKEEADRLAVAVVRAGRLGNEKALATYYADNPHIVEGDTVVAEERGVLAAQGTAMRLESMLAGTRIGLTGVSLVATAPEHRRNGAVDRLVRTLLTRGRRHGDVIAGGYPFYEPFYLKFGYARTEFPQRFVVAPSQLPSSNLRRHVRQFETRGDFKAIKRCYDAWCAVGTGPLVRSDFWWNHRVLDSIQDGAVYVGPRSRTIEGYILYETSGPPGDFATDLTVREFVTTTLEAHQGLDGFLSTLGDQFKRICLTLPYGQGVSAFTGVGEVKKAASCTRYHVVGELLAGAVVRVLDLRRALKAHPSPANSGVRTTIGLDLSDPLFRDQNGPYDITVDSAGAAAKRGRRAKLRVEATIGAFSQIYTGAVSARALLASGRIRGSAEAAALLDTVFAGPPPFWSELNGF